MENQWIININIIITIIKNNYSLKGIGNGDFLSLSNSNIY